ncbi:hypothetical protein ACWGKA_30370 [Streptomyces luteogriseus]
MTGPEEETAAADEVEFQRLGEQLLRTTKNPRDRAAVRALVEERSILSVPALRHALIIHTDDGEMAHFQGLAGHQYGLGLDKGQQYFLDLVLSMTGIGITPLAGIQGMDDRRLPILLRALLRLAGNNTIAVGVRL